MGEKATNDLIRGFHNLGVTNMAQSLEHYLPERFFQDDEFMLAFKQAKEDARKEIETIMRTWR